MRKIADLRILLPWPSRYMPQDQAPTATRKIAMALGPLLEIRRAYRTGANPPGGGPSWRTGMSLTLAIPGFFLICASVIFFFTLWDLVKWKWCEVCWVEIGEEEESEAYVWSYASVLLCVRELHFMGPIGRSQVVSHFVALSLA